MVGQPGDIYEQEADRVQRQPTEEGDETLRTVSFKGRTSSLLLRQPYALDRDSFLRKKRFSRGGNETSAIDKAVPAAVDDVLHASGQPLSQSVRSFFEPRFGYDLATVRIHVGRSASEAAEALNARAFTSGSHIVFGKQAYAPTTAEGRRLLAHELTHTIQQSNSRVYRSDRLVLSDESSVYEREANAVAAEITRDVQFSPHMGEPRVSEFGT